MIRKHCKLAGKVQGLGFRGWIEGQAMDLGLKGWVKNINGNKIELVVEGDEQVVERFLKRVREGNGASKIEHEDTIDEEPTGEFKQFNIVF